MLKIKKILYFLMLIFVPFMLCSCDNQNIIKDTKALKIVVDKPCFIGFWQDAYFEEGNIYLVLEEIYSGDSIECMDVSKYIEIEYVENQLDDVTKEFIEEDLVAVLVLETSAVSDLYVTEVGAPYLDLTVNGIEFSAEDFDPIFNGCYAKDNLRDIKGYEYIYLWFTVLFNLQEGYKTDFLDFATRAEYVKEIYNSCKIKDLITVEQYVYKLSDN